MFGVKTKKQRKRDILKMTLKIAHRIYKRSEGKRNGLTCELINTSSWLRAFWTRKKFIPALVIYTHTLVSNENKNKDEGKWKN